MANSITTGHPALARDSKPQEIADRINDVQRGRLNAIASSVTLSTGTTGTTFTDSRLGPGSWIGFMPTTLNAAAALTALYYTNRLKGSAVVNHPNSTQTDRTYVPLVIS